MLRQAELTCEEENLPGFSIISWIEGAQGREPEDGSTGARHVSRIIPFRFRREDGRCVTVFEWDDGLPDQG